MLYEPKDTNKKKIIEQRCMIDPAIYASDVVNCSSQIESVRNPNNYLFNRFSERFFLPLALIVSLSF